MTETTTTDPMAVARKQGVPGVVDPVILQSVDTRTKSWRQADVACGRRMTHLADAARPVTPASVQAAAAIERDNGLMAVTVEVDGWVILNQTCDVHKSAATSPFVTVGALHRNRPDIHDHAWNGRLTGYAALPAIGDNSVVDLNHLFSIEKGALVGMDRIAGWSSDEEIRRFQTVVSRAYKRFAFPDDFSRCVVKLKEKIKHVSGRVNSPEGQLFDKVHQVRVESAPHWSNDHVSAQLLFIVDSGVLPMVPDGAIVPEDYLRWLGAKKRTSSEIADRLIEENDPVAQGWLWARLVEAWAALCVPDGIVTHIEAEVVAADEITADRLWATDELDLDYLSIAS